MRRRVRQALLLAMPLLLLGGCSRTDGFTVLSTKSMNMVLLPDAYKGRYTGLDVRPIFLIFPTGLPDMQRAVNDALNDGRGNLLVNADAYVRRWYIPFIYGEMSYIVRGDVYDVQVTATEEELEAKAREERLREDKPLRPGETRIRAKEERRVRRVD